MMHRRTTAPLRRLALLKTLGWALGFLALADVAINLAFPLPADPRTPPSAMARYSDYGRSIEAKLRRDIGASDAVSSPLALAGWIDSDCLQAIPAEAGRRIVSVYGMSFSGHIGAALEKIDGQFKTIAFGGPGAPPNHTFKCFETRFAATPAGVVNVSEVVVFGILASSAKGLLSMTGATTGFESPAPFGYPRYVLADGVLRELPTPVPTLQAWRDALASAQRLSEVEAELARHDNFYKTYLFRASAADASAIFRMARRAVAQQHIRSLSRSVLGPDGFADRSDTGPVLQAIVKAVASRTRAAGKRPVILLIHDRASGTALEKLLGPTLDAAGIDWISTAQDAPTSNPANFIGDGHFTEEANRRIALRLRSLLVQAPR